jgi:hypothetical protein
MKYYRLIVAGSRTWSDEDTMVRAITQFCRDFLDPLRAIKGNEDTKLEIISGHARGADQMGEKVAHTNKLKLTIMKAQWDLHGVSAGYMRNEDMARYAAAGQTGPGGCIVFWDGKSRGSMHMFRLARDYKLQTVLVSPNKGDIKDIEDINKIMQHAGINKEEKD